MQVVLKFLECKNEVRQRFFFDVWNKNEKR